MQIQEIWTRTLEELHHYIDEKQYEQWVAPLETPEITLSEKLCSVAFSFPNRFKLDWFRSQYESLFHRVLQQVVGRQVVLAFAVERSSLGITPLNRANNTRLLKVVSEERLKQPQIATGLNPLQTFDRLIVGKSNQIAHAAGLKISDKLGTSFNPLFIYGGVGLGKTHLLQAIGNTVLNADPNRKVRYINAERFVSDVVKAFQQRSFDAFKALYNNLDLLLIDDVQFFAGKDKTQEEFFYAFEALLSKKAQIVLTSDTYPKQLIAIEQRLISRFDAGLTVAIDPPMLEMRVAILKQNAKNQQFELPEDVAFFIAKNVKANVRELEGSLRKVMALAQFTHTKVTLELARTALRDYLRANSRYISVDNIQKNVAEFFHISVEQILSRQRPRHIARARQIAMYLCKELTQKSLPEIGSLFGKRDHTTVLYAHRLIANERSRNQEFNQQLIIIEQKITS